jgi:hypothetical protein
MDYPSRDERMAASSLLKILGGVFVKNIVFRSTVALRNVTLGALVLVFLVTSAAAQNPVTTTSGGTAGMIPVFTSNSNV